MDQTTAKKVIGTIYDRLFDIVTYRPTTSVNPIPFDPYNRQSTMLHLTKDMAISEADFGNAYGPNNIGGLPSQAETFSGFVDRIPQINTDYTPSDNNVSQEYDTIVHGANSNEPIDPHQQALYDRAVATLYDTLTVTDAQGHPHPHPVPNVLYKDYLANRKAYMNALADYRSTQLGYDLTQPLQQRQWLAKATALQDAVDSAYDLWRGGDAQVVENALQTEATSINSAIRYALERARSSFDQTSQPSLAAGPNWHLSYAIPSDWANDSGAVNYSQFDLNSHYLNTSYSSTFESWGGGASYGFGFWSIGASAGGSSTTVHSHMDANDFRLSAKIANVSIMRPWFDTSFFRLNHWFINGMGAGSVSNGQLVGNSNGLLPLVPVSMIVARDIEVTANFTSSDYDYMHSQWEASASFGFGPFSFGGHYSHSQTNEYFRSEANGGTLKVPGLHVLGWVSTVMPFSPPTGA